MLSKALESKDMRRRRNKRGRRFHIQEVHGQDQNVAAKKNGGSRIEDLREVVHVMFEGKGGFIER